jgi:hypothetical protein
MRYDLYIRFLLGLQDFLMQLLSKKSSFYCFLEQKAAVAKIKEPDQQ